MATIAEAFTLARQHHQAGALSQAAQLYRAILRADPVNGSALFYLGATCQALQDLAGAVSCYRQFLRLQPEHAEVHYQLGLALHKQGQLAQAASAYEQAARLQPGHVEAHNNRGVALKALGRLEEAVFCYRRALHLRPDYADAHNNLGVVLKEQGHLDDAMYCYRQALRLRPEYAEAWSNLANALHQRGAAAEAVDGYRQALRFRPNFAGALYNLGILLLELGQAAEAETTFRAALRLTPAFPEGHNNLGVALQKQGRPDEAVACFREAQRLQPNFADASYNLGNALRDLGEVEAAASAFGQAVRLRPDHAEGHNNLASALVELGQTEEARDHCLQALRFRPDWAAPLFTLAELAANGRSFLPDDQSERIGALLTDPNLSAADSSLLHFALAMLRDRAGEHDEAFALYRQGNALKSRLLHEAGLAFHPETHRQAIDQLIATFDVNLFEHVRGFGLDTELPVFIVGMPRSGTTLVEQILARHPQVHGAGELKDVGQLVDELPARLGAPEGYPRCLARLTREMARALAERYLGRLDRRAGLQKRPEVRRVTDKLPMNFLHLGLLAVLFPRARVIHCRRDPRDVCLSCYFQHFRELNFAWDLADLGQYHRDYERLMAHWRAVLPVQPLELVYEELVADQEAVSRRLLSFCGLDWDARCLAFHDSGRPVQTMSKLQVRQPIYTRSIGRWQRYKTHLRPLLEALELSPGGREG